MINLLLCGGSGERLWPVSRKSFPKQFCRLTDSRSFFQNTLLRNSTICSKHIIVTNRANFFVAVDQIQELQRTENSRCYLLEPEGRNTAPAIALGCFACGGDDIVLVTPADHVVRDEQEYIRAVELAEKEAEKGFLVTFGIKPEHAETGYGYIETEGCERTVQNVVSFREKPDAETAQKYVDSGRHYWNSGIFCFKAGVFLEELRKYAPEIYAKAEEAFRKSLQVDGVRNIGDDEMADIPAESIDVAVLEKSSRVKVVPSVFGWNDVGSFDALCAEMRTDADGNLNAERHVAINSKDNMIISDKSVALVDVDGLIVVDTDDALLVMKRGSSQKIKDVVARLKSVDGSLC